MSKTDLIDEIINKRIIIFEISLHSFWNIILNNQLKENEVPQFLNFMNSDLKMINNLLFHRFQNEDELLLFLSKLVNVRSILLYGELSKDKTNDTGFYFMKLNGINLIHDINDHILPKYPKEIRGKLIESSLEASIIDLYKIQENLSLDFINSISNSEFSYAILDILSVLDFEDKICLISSVTQKNEFLGNLLSLSNTTKKVEKTSIKFNLQKNIKENLIITIFKIQFFLNEEELCQTFDTYKTKSEIELLKILIKKKESLLKLLFKDSFQPSVDKMIIPRNCKFLSCVSKDKVNLDFWIKIILDRYHKDQIKELQSLSEEELRICYKRLLKSIELICPYLLEVYKENSTNKNEIIKSIFSIRYLLIEKLQENFIGKRFKFRLSQNVQELIHFSKISLINTNEEFQSIRTYFEITNVNLELSDLIEILKKLYDIDSELFPGIEIKNFNQKDITKFKFDEMVDEINFLRLAIASCMICINQSWEDIRDIIESNTDRWGVMKKLETALIKSELVNVDNGLIDTERIFLTKLLNSCRKSKNNNNEEKLKEVYIEVKKISCRNNAETFDMGENIKYFNKIPTKEEKINILCNEVDDILKSFKRTLDKNLENDSIDNYKKLELLLEDMEMNFVEKNSDFRDTWIYSLYEIVNSIENLISNQTNNKPELNKEPIRNVIIKYLQDIKQWISNTKNLQTDLFNRLNSNIRKLNNSSFSSDRKIRMSSCDLDFNSSHFNDEKRAFEKAFFELEEQINEIDFKKDNKNNYNKLIDTKIMDKDDEELRKLILSLEKQLAENGLNKSELKEAKLWLSDRSREQLEEDCRNLTHKVLVKKLEEFLNNQSENYSKNNELINDHLSKFEDDINLKLTKYQDLCDSVEKLKIPQTYAKRSSSPLSYQYDNTMTGEKKMKQEASPNRKPQIQDNDNDSIDLYFHKRLSELQNYMKSSTKYKSNFKDHLLSNKNNDTNILVDGFEIEEEKTPRYYSMKLQDIQHDRKEDELATILYQMEQDRLEMIERNKNLQQQVFLSQNVIDTQEKKLEAMEKADHIIKHRLRSAESNEKQDIDSKSKFEDVRLLKNELRRLTATTASAQHQLDQQNLKLIDLATTNDNLQHENNNISVKNKYLQRSFQKLEGIFNDLIRQLEYSKQNVLISRNDNSYHNMKDSSKDYDYEKRLRQSENDKVELVRKLDIIEQQNELLKEHCERLDNELSNSNKTLAESQALTDNYKQQSKQLADILDNIKLENDRYHTSSMNSFGKHKDEEIKRLKNKIIQLENRLLAMNQI